MAWVMAAFERCSSANTFNAMALQTTVAEFWAQFIHDGPLADAVLYFDSAVLAALPWTQPTLVGQIHARQYIPLSPPIIRCLQASALLHSDTAQHNATRPPLRAPEPSHAVFLLASHIAHYRAELQVLLSHHCYSQCTIYTGVPERWQVALPAPSDTDKAAFYQEVNDASALSNCNASFDAIQQTLQSWHSSHDNAPMSQCSATPVMNVAIHHAPVGYSALTDHIFTLPSCSHAQAVPSASLVASEDPNAELVPLLARVLLATTSSPLARPRIFPMGAMASRVAGAMAQLIAETDTETTPGPSIVLVDRALDLVAPCLHKDNLLDHLYHGLLALDNSSDDRAVVVPPTTASKHASTADLLPEPAYSIAYALSSARTASQRPGDYTLVQLLSLSHREGMNVVRKKLNDAVTHASLKIKLPKALGKVTAPQLNKVLLGCQAHPNVWESHNTPLVIAQALVTILQSSAQGQWDEALGLEKVLLLTANEGSESSAELLARILDILPDVTDFPDQWLSEDICQSDTLASPNVTGKNDVRSYPLDTVMALVTVAYSLVGSDQSAASFSLPSADQELATHEFAFQARLESSFERWLCDKVDPTAHSDEHQFQLARFRAWLPRAFRLLRSLAETRKDLTFFGQLHQPQTATPYVPLIRQVVEALCQSWTQRPTDSPDPNDAHPLWSDRTQRMLADVQLYRKSSALSSYISGLSKFIKQRAVHPFDGPGPVYIFVIGGITFWELSLVEQVLKDHPTRPPVILGSTALISGPALVDQLFQLSHLEPM
ncbi:Sec1 domain-containing protein 2 [Dimargaris verticillata]|uniref:Sec1 domain-containing protein 2 n=1 Tax=Dimargaris verticillata TaxID=2761393 RepID=A0A9W8EFL8_9FUNG|nr:Sec1 domain-containing protein 2 [Dimargaris verticillata]